MTRLEKVLDRLATSAVIFAWGVIFATCATGCDDDTIRIHVVKGQLLAGHVHDIEDAWGVRVETVDHDACAIEMNALPDGHKVQGHYRRGRIACQPTDWACAHEIGHAAGLGHYDGEDHHRLMRLYTGFETYEVADWEVDEVEALARRQSACMTALGGVL